MVECRKVGGVVKKGDIIIASDSEGHGMAAFLIQSIKLLQIIGRALETKTEAWRN